MFARAASKIGMMLEGRGLLASFLCICIVRMSLPEKKKLDGHTWRALGFLLLLSVFVLRGISGWL
jgi:hypothetical protein